MIIKRTTKLLGIAFLSMISLSSTAQDLIARQAPSDKHLKDVRNVKINGRTLSSSADLNNPASDIYFDWQNTSISQVSGRVPANYKIDLSNFCMPTTSRLITSNYGPRWGRQHAGLDIKVYIGDTIRAAFDGKVRISAFNGSGYGYYIVIRHPNGLETLYGHMSKLIAKENQIVRAGDVIGLGGNTGRSTGSHLHFETRILGKAINPALMFDFPNQDVVSNTFIYRGGTVTNASSIANSNAKKIEADNAKHEKEVAASVNVSNTEFKESTNAPATHEESNNTEIKNHYVTPSRKNKNSNKQKSASASYTVKDGDTLYKIAREHGTTVSKICKLNGIKENSMIRKGQVIKCS